MEASKFINFNMPQMFTVLAPQKNIYLEWGRGTGKSTIIAWRIKELAFRMPRGKFFLVGATYQQILTRTLPSTIAGLEILGFYKDVHYWIGRRPPKSYKINEPFQPPGNYEHCMIWCTGAVFDLVSMDNKNSARGLNTDGGVGDEALLFDYEELSTNVLFTNRGHLDKFGHEPLHHSVLFASSTPVNIKGKWLIEMEKQALIDPDEIYYSRASSEFNRHNLGNNWFKEAKRILPDLIYNAEILNIRPGKIEGGFYANLDENKHTYTNYNNGYLETLGYDFQKLQEIDCRMDSDCITDKPISVAFDYGAVINTLVAEQDIGRKSRFLNSFYVKSPGLVTETVEQFCKYYKYHGDKTVDYYYDHTAVFKDAVRTETFADVVTDTFEANGWNVNRIYIGQAASHDARYLLWNRVFIGDDDVLPEVELNRDKCRYVILSMQMAGVKQGRKGFEKDKGSERTKGPQEEATHFSDAADTLMVGKYGRGNVGTFI